ncbi:ABC transporter permease [Pseudochelatococcus contaminans]|uniref:Sulfonate transport system permease protein n=1 Tax=Pseudochelatococcus contaminans TaxID=1538103 RepID=A0A7W5Z548_9HYPH|nr:ABC transporter permease [Pseudochelatococcus contaminans]MBB3810282.1 sulfonate transport system permease protein [Pseudochelatococcus contaminans]
MSADSIIPPRAVAVPHPVSALVRRIRALDWRPLLSFAAIIALWFAAYEFNWVRAKFLPSPVAVVERLWFEIHSGTIVTDLLETLRRNIIGLAIGGFIGLALGALLGISSGFAKIVGPTVLAQRQTALFAWVPLLSVWFGGADVGKIAFISVAAFQPIVINTWRGLTLVPKTYKELAESLSFTRWDYVRLVAIPNALPTIFTGFHAALIYAWLATVGAELFLNIAPGLGGRLTEGSQLFEIDLLFLTIILFGIVGLFYNSLAERTEGLFLKWNSR